MSKITDEILGHADEADGIEEYDNPLPDWWLGMFYLCVIWGVIYAVEYHFISDRSQEAAYQSELAMAAETWPELGKMVADADMSPETLKLGEETYQSTCVSCHGGNMEGGIGPNLVDDEWIHGSDFESIANVITEGIAAKGMPAWGSIIGPTKVGAVTSFILSKQTGEPAAPAVDAEGEEDAEAIAEALAEAEAAAEDGDPHAKGKAVFAKNCAACHMADMTGGVGPSLVDDEWIHGDSLEDIRGVIERGVPEKGMISWKGVIDDDSIEAVAAYIHHIAHNED